MLAGVGVWAFRSGDPAKLLYPTNSFGQICGQVDPDYHHRHLTIIVNNEQHITFTIILLNRGAKLRGLSYSSLT